LLELFDFLQAQSSANRLTCDEMLSHADPSIVTSRPLPPLMLIRRQPLWSMMCTSSPAAMHGSDILMSTARCSALAVGRRRFDRSACVTATCQVIQPGRRSSRLLKQRESVVTYERSKIQSLAIIILLEHPFLNSVQVYMYVAART
jgi:hypothetical protein